MAEVCRVCGCNVVADAAFCHSCGSRVDAFVVDLDRRDHAHPSARATAAMSLGSVAVPVFVIALLGLLGFLFFLPGQDPGEVSDGTAVEPPLSPTPTQAPATVAPTEPTAQPTSTPRERATPTSVPSVLDLTPFRDLAATHLAVGIRGDLHLLDFATGVWSRTEVNGLIGGLRPLARGALVVLRDGSVRYAEANGAPPTELFASGSRFLLGTTGDLVVFGVRDNPSSERAEARRVNGEGIWSVDVPAETSAVGVTEQGDVIIQASERIGLLDPATGTFDLIGTGSVVGTVGNLVLVESCTADLDCGTDQIDVLTRQRTRVRDDRGWFENLGGGSLRFRSNRTLDVVRFRLTDGVLTQTDGQAALPGFEPAPMAVDFTGHTVDIVAAELRFFDPTGELITTIPSPLEACCQDASLALLTAT